MKIVHDRVSLAFNRENSRLRNPRIVVPSNIFEIQADLENKKARWKIPTG
jgi:hypothetical protein